MNKAPIVLILLTCFIACIGKHTSDSQQAILNQTYLPAYQPMGDTLKVDLSRSSIYWKGTKMNGAGKHEGQIRLQNAFVIVNDVILLGGKFSVDMNTIQVTDIPEHEPVPRKRFVDHMKSEDFFDTNNFPSSKFEITQVKRISADSLQVSGNLTIKDITNNISFVAENNAKVFSANFTIDRFQWDIAYEGSWADRTLVDKDIELKIKIYLGQSKLPFSE